MLILSSPRGWKLFEDNLTVFILLSMLLTFFLSHSTNSSTGQLSFNFLTPLFTDNLTLSSLSLSFHSVQWACSTVLGNVYVFEGPGTVSSPQ